MSNISKKFVFLWTYWTYSLKLIPSRKCGDSARIEQGSFEMDAIQMDIYQAIRLFIIACVAIAFLFVSLLIAIEAFMEDHVQ